MIISTFSFAQRDEIDSLKTLLDKDDFAHDSLRFETAFKLYQGQIEHSEGNPLPELEKLLQATEKISPKRLSQKLKAQALSVIGLYYDYAGDLSQAIDYYYQALRIAEKYNNKELIAENLNNLGYVYDMQGNYQKALEVYEQAIVVKRKLNDKKSLSVTLNNLAYVYKELEEYAKSLKYFEECLNIQKSENNEKDMSSTLNNIGLVYEKMGQFSIAYDYLKSSLDLEKKFNRPFETALSYIALGTNLYQQKKYIQAQYYFEKGDSLARALDVPELKIANYNNLSKFYAGKGDFEKAYRNYVAYTAVKDSMINEKSNQQIAELQSEYESEKKDLEINFLNEEKKKREAQFEAKKIQNTALSVISILLLFILFYIFRSYRQKKKANIEIEFQKQLAEKERDESQRQKKITEAKNHEIVASINYAKRIQEAILPRDKIVKSHLPDSFIFYQARDIVSGDFYWIHSTDNGEILFAVVDCTGHGVPGAFMSIVGNNGLNKAVIEDKISQPSFILDALNKHVISSLRNEGADVKDGMDIALCSINFKTGTLQYAGAANPLYIVSDGILSEIKADRQSIGDSKIPYTNYNIQLKKGDCIYIFTDGFADQFGGERNRKFTYKKLKEVLTELSSYPSDIQHQKLSQIFQDWKGTQDQTDDVCIVGVRF